MDKDFYIRYRIYVQSGIKGDNSYPRRLCNSLKKLHENIKDDMGYYNRALQEEPIIKKTFMPLNLEHVNPAYFKLITNITEYFVCRAIWKTVMIKGSIKPINTLEIVGFRQDMLLAYHYISKIINNLEDMRYNMTREFRRTRILARRRGIDTSNRDNAKKRSSEHFYRRLEYINKTTKDILEGRPIYPIFETKLGLIDKEIILRDWVIFRKYNYKRGSIPKISNAFSREGKFQNMRIITVK